MAWLALISCALGAWAIAAPFAFAWDVCPWVYYGNIITGAAVFLLSGVYFLRPVRRLYWLNWFSALGGIWLFVCPWIAYGNLSHYSYWWANWVPGALIAILSVIVAVTALRR